MSQTIVALDSTQIKEYLICPHKWYYGHVENLRFWRAKTKAVDIGSFVHKLLETFYVIRSLNPKEDRFVTSSNVLKLFKAGKLGQAYGLTKEEIEFILGRFNQYVITYMAYDYVPLHFNGKIGVELGFSTPIYKDDDFLFVLEGKIDLISRINFNAPHCFIDNKTQSRYGVLYNRKPQFRCYGLATGFNYGQVNYFKVDKTFKVGETFRRDLFYFSEQDHREWYQYLIEQVYIPIGQFLKSNKGIDGLKPNLGSCAGQWEQNKCYYAMITEAPTKEIKELVKRTYYYKVPKWIPWNVEEDETQNVE